MKIAVMGAGNVGTAVTHGAAKAGHSVTVTSRDPEHARAVADQVGATTTANPADAARGADVIVLAVPYTEVPGVAAQLGDAAARKVVIDPTNPIKADYSGLAVTGRSGAEELQERLPGAKVVKAFNTVFAANQSTGAADGTPLDGLYAGDDAHAKETVRELLSGIGFHPIDVGPLSQALALEHMAFVNISLNAANGWPWQSGWKLVGPTG